MTFKMPKTPEEFGALDDLDKLEALARVMAESGERCAANMLTAGTWIEETFNDTAVLMHGIALRLHVVRALEERVKGRSRPPRR